MKGVRQIYAEDPSERLRPRLKRNGDCLEYMGCRGRHGYGRMTVDGKSMYAHRLAWQLANGPIPEGLCVLHHCDNPPCCNPAHLFLGTLKDNAQDMVRKGRDAARVKPHRVRRGTAINTAKLTEREVLLILRDPGPQRVVAERFGVTRSTIEAIRNGRTWTHVPRSHDLMLDLAHDADFDDAA